MVSYVGSTAARALLHDHELWLSPESLDSRSSFLQKQGLPAKVNCHIFPGVYGQRTYCFAGLA